MKKTSKIVLALCFVLATLLSLCGCALDFKVNAEENLQEKISLCLKDDWHVYVDGDDKGETEEWYTGFLGDGNTVSLPYETSSDGYTSVIWFATEFEADFEMLENQRVIIELEGVQYYTKLWMNGNLAGEHYGSYGKFYIDVTDYIRPGETNLIAMRLCAPKGGTSLNGVPDTSIPTWLGSFQHIQTPVYVNVVPDTYITDTYVNTVYENGNMEVELTLNNATSRSRSITVNTNVSEADETASLLNATKTFRVKPGEQKVKYTVKLEDYKLWDVDNPNLYDVAITLTDNRSGNTDYSQVTVGYKDFRVDDEGYFVLNGERIFIKSCHTSGYILGSVDVGADIERQKHQLDYLKAAGFNTVRWLDGLALPELMDYADRIGLLMYEENATSWTQTDCDSTAEIFAHEISEVALRDRNHVSFAILGMLNETIGKNETSQRYQAALDGPKTIREIDNDVLMLLSSGRWDYDDSIASACNPGSTEWTAYMGNEGLEEGTEVNATYESAFSGIGDIHYYPSLPYSASIGDMFRIIGDVRAAFVSEAGAGSQCNIISDYCTIQQEDNISLGNSSNTSIARQITTMQEMYEEYDINKIYGSLEELLKDSQALQSEQRNLLVDYIRSNEKINGYSMTQGSDVGYRGEGVLEGIMNHKEGMFDSILNCWSDLRFCINIRDYNLYNTDNFNLQVDLSNFNALDKDLDYTVLMSIIGEGKTVWSKSVNIKANDSFVIPVVSEDIDITALESGEYTISCVLCGKNTMATKTFWVTNKKDMPKTNATVYYVGLNETQLSLLKEAGATLIEYTGQDVKEKSTIIFGKNNVSSKLPDLAFEAANTKGCHVVGAAWGAFGDYGLTYLPIDQPGMPSNSPNWLYHNDAIIYDTAITDGLMTDCLVSPLYYEDIYDAHYYFNMQTPDEIHAFSFFIGVDGGVSEQDMIYGVTCGSFNYGAGKITVCTFDLSEGAGSPTADRMLINMVNYIK